MIFVKLRILVQAETEAAEAARWHEEKQPGLGFQFIDSLTRALESIERFPRRNPRLEKIGASREVRRILLQKFSYKVIFEILEEEILVLAVAHQKRRPYYWRRRK